MKAKCNVCGGRRAVKLADKASRIFRCGDCRHTFKNMPPHKQERYEESYFSKAHKNWFSYPNYKLFEYIRGKSRELLGDKKLKILDVGCGKGSFLKYIRAKEPGSELHGIDLTTNNSPKFHFIRGDIMKDKIDGKYDVVTSLAVIEHVDDPLAMVMKMRELVVPGGLLFVMTDDDDSMIYGIARFLKRLGMREAHDQLYELHHLQCFTRKSLKAIMEKNELDVIRIKNHNYPVDGVDMPNAGRFTEMIYRVGVGAIFNLSALCGNGILQTAVCRKRSMDTK